MWEWNDAVISSSRGLRGGSFQRAPIEENPEGLRPLRAYVRASGVPTYENDDPSVEGYYIGFRVATVPEPTVGVSLILAGGLLLSRRKRPSAL